MTGKEVLPNARFGRLTVIAVIKGAKNRHPMARSICDCGKKRTVRQTWLRTGKTTECVCCTRKSAWGRRARGSLESRSVARQHGSYTSNAIRKGIEFSLTRPECRSLFKSPCYYCGQVPSRPVSPKNDSESVMLNGIDRIDNNKGYVAGNVVPCCSQCNYAKRDLSADQFFDWLKRISSFQWTLLQSAVRGATAPGD